MKLRRSSKPARSMRGYQTHADIYRALRWQLRRFSGKTSPEDALVAVFTLYSALHATRAKVLSVQTDAAREAEIQKAHQQLMESFPEMVRRFRASAVTVRDPVCVPQLAERKRPAAT